MTYLGRLTYEEAVSKSEHLRALGQTEVFIDADSAPWDKAIRVEKGCSYRLSGPIGCNIVACVAGLTLKWSVDFEGRAANGSSVSQFDRDRLREVALKLSPEARMAFAEMLASDVLPPMVARTKELREYLNKQLDSEDCVHGLIAFAQGK